MDAYIKKYLKLIKDCKNDKEICNIINKLWEDGFQDGSEIELPLRNKNDD